MVASWVANQGKAQVLSAVTHPSVRNRTLTVPVLTIARWWRVIGYSIAQGGRGFSPQGFPASLSESSSFGWSCSRILLLDLHQLCMTYSPPTQRLRSSAGGLHSEKKWLLAESPSGHMHISLHSLLMDAVMGWAYRYKWVFKIGRKGKNGGNEFR